jgi:hypothetical protein
MRKLIMSVSLCLGISILVRPTQDFADVIRPAQVDIYASKLGIKPDLETLKQTGTAGVTRFIGTVVEPCKLADLGFKEVKKGDRVEVTRLQNGEWKGKVLSTKQERTFKLSIDWDTGD